MALTTRLFANNVRTTLAGAINSTDLTITFATGAGATMPAPNSANGEYFELTLQDSATGLRTEIIAISTMTGDIGTIHSGGRGQQGTSAQSWAAGDIAFLAVTKGSLDGLTQPYQIQSNTLLFASAAGTADALTATLSPAVSVLTDGMKVYIKAASANATTTPTLALNGLTARTIVKGSGSALAAGDIIGAGHVLELVYKLSATQWILQNPGGVQTTSMVGASGAVKNLSVSTTGTSATITVTADEVIVRDASYNFKTLNTVSLSVSGASSGANGLDTGTLATSTWYALYVIYNPTTDTKAGLLSLSATAPTLPSGYSFFAKIGDIRTDGTANKYPLSIIQKNNRVRYKVAAGSNTTAYPTLASGVQGSITTPTWVAVGVANFIPTTATAIIVLPSCQNTANSSVLVAPNNGFGAINSATLTPPITFGTPSAMSASYATDIQLESTNIYVAQQAANSLTQCVGWGY